MTSTQLAEMLMDDRKRATSNAKLLQDRLRLSDTWRTNLKDQSEDFVLKNGYYNVTEMVDISDVKPSLA